MSCHILCSLCNHIHSIIGTLHSNHASGRQAGMIAFIWLLLSGGPVMALDMHKGPEPVYEETSIYLLVQGAGGLEVPALMMGDSAYLSLPDVFDFLKIRNSLTAGGDTLAGFFISEQSPYLVDNVHKKISFRGQQFAITGASLIRTESGLYLSTAYFSRIFGLTCKFDFHNLTVTMSAKEELPVVREMRRELMRRNVGKLKGQLKADTVIGRRYPLFQLGMADWSVISTQRPQQADNTWVNLSLGATLAGGEATVDLNYNNFSTPSGSQPHEGSNIARPFDYRRQYYRWRFVNNDHAYLRQVTAGKVFTPSTASLFNPVVGIQLTNTPTTYRRSFGSYTLSDFTEAGWTVELYVNDALVDYTKADASGFFSFQVPLVYGNSTVKLRFYGPWGEERTKEEQINIPFNFLPRHEFEYSLTGGIVEDGKNSLFSRFQMNYGATRYFTLGAGVEYLSSIANAKAMPFVNASFRMAANLLLSGEYTYGVRTRGILSYRLPSNLQVDLDYTRYKKGQQAIIYNYREERKVVVSRPFTGRYFSLFSRLTLNQAVLPGSKYTTTEWLTSGAIWKIGMSLTHYAIFQGSRTPFIYSNFGLSFRLPGNIQAMPQLQYGYNQHSVRTLRCELGKYLFRDGYLNGAYEWNKITGSSNFSIGFRYNLPFSQVGLSAFRNNGTTTTVQSAKGSLVHNGYSGVTDFDNRINVGTGGIVLMPFLDLDNDGQRDAGEPKVAGLKLKNVSGRVAENQKDTLLCLTGMEAYTAAFIQLEQNSFDNIAWQLKKPAISVMIEPNRLKPVEVPVSIMNEVSGNVHVLTNNVKKEPGRIWVCFYRADASLAARVLTERDGFFSYTGLPPGKYTALADTAPLHKTGAPACSAPIPFTINANREGDLVDGLELLIE